jgi:hypothetical protein
MKIVGASMSSTRISGLEPAAGYRIVAVAGIIGLIAFATSPVAADPSRRPPMPEFNSGQQPAAGTRPHIAAPDAARPERARTDAPIEPSTASRPSADRGLPPRADAEPARSNAARGKVQALGQLPDSDFYQQRAKSLLGEDADSAKRELSLQAAYPGYNVIVCEGGCYGRSNKLVQFAPAVDTNAPRVPKPVADAATAAGEIRPASAALPSIDAKPAAAAIEPSAQSIPADTAIQCVAGCYGQQKSYASASRSASHEAARREIEKLTSAGKAPTAADADGRDVAVRSASATPPTGATGGAERRWMTTVARIGEGEDKTGTAKTAAVKTGAAKTGAAKMGDGQSRPKKARTKRRVGEARAGSGSPSGEWFQRINADRAVRGQ